LTIAKAIANPKPDPPFLRERSLGGVLPMYGMPSRVRDLYHHDPTRKQKVATIDRDLDLAITEFSPSAEKTKDKRIYTSIGFTAPLLPDKESGLRPASEQPLAYSHF